MQFFVVSSVPGADGRFFDTERFPKLGFITPTPSLTIKKLKEVTLEERTAPASENQIRTNWAFGITLIQEDAIRLKEMTATNVLKKVLIMVGDEPVVAPTILAPLETGTFEITCTERALMEIIKKQLAIVERQSQL